MSSPKPPSPPDPVKTAQAQGAMNRETAISQYLLGATNQVTPFGSLTYTSLGSWGDELNGRSGGASIGTGGPLMASTRGASQQAKNPHSRSIQTGNDSTPMINPAWEAWERTNAGNRVAASTASRTPSSPFSGSAYDVPHFQVTQTLTPDLQATVDNFLGTAKSLSGTVHSTLGQQFDPSNLPARAGNLTGGQGLNDVPLNLSWSGPGARYTIDDAGEIQRDIGADDWSEDRQRVEEALLHRINPSFDRDRSRMEADLVARGVRPGTVAYDRAMDQLNRSLTDARFQAVLAGGQEQSRLADLELAQGNFRNAAQAQQYGQNANDAAFYNSAQQQNWQQSFAGDQFRREGIGMNNNTANLRFNQQLAAGQFNNQNRASALEEAMALRSLPLNEINALLSGTQIAGPKFQSTPQPGVAGVDYAGLVQNQYQGQLAAYNAAQQNRAGMLGGIAGIGSSLLGMFSDRRLKTDIKRIGRTDNGLPIYAFRYKSGGPVQIGLMAQDVEKVMPEAVGERDGFKTVRYDLVAGVV